MDEINTTPASGLAQASTILQGYVSRLIDVELNTSMAQVNANIVRATTQNPILNSPDTGVSVGSGGLSIGPTALLLAAGAALLFFALRKA